MNLPLYTVSGRLVSKNVSRYRIKWDGKSRSKIQFQTKQLLKPLWKDDMVFEEFPVYGSLLKIDIYNATKRIAIEVNGPQHDKYHSFFHDGTTIKFLAGLKRDLTKYDWLEQNNIRLVEYVEAEVKDTKSFYERLYS